MGRGGFRLLFTVAAMLGALASAAPATASSSCSSRLLADWQDGRIDRTYPIQCYRQALTNLPEDVRVYSTAQTDITRALQAQLRTTFGTAAERGDDEDGAVSPLVVLAITGGLLLAAGSLAAIVR
jgi:hypothetical protein